MVSFDYIYPAQIIRCHFRISRFNIFVNNEERKQRCGQQLIFIIIAHRHASTMDNIIYNENVFNEHCLWFKLSHIMLN